MYTTVRYSQCVYCGMMDSQPNSIQLMIAAAVMAGRAKSNPSLKPRAERLMAVIDKLAKKSHSRDNDAAAARLAALLVRIGKRAQEKEARWAAYHIGASEEADAPQPRVVAPVHPNNPAAPAPAPAAAARGDDLDIKHNEHGDDAAERRRLLLEALSNGSSSAAAQGSDADPNPKPKSGRQKREKLETLLKARDAKRYDKLDPEIKAFCNKGRSQFTDAMLKVYEQKESIAREVTDENVRKKLLRKIRHDLRFLHKELQVSKGMLSRYTKLTTKPDDEDAASVGNGDDSKAPVGDDSAALGPNSADNGNDGGDDSEATEENNQPAASSADGGNQGTGTGSSKTRKRRKRGKNRNKK